MERSEILQNQISSLVFRVTRFGYEFVKTDLQKNGYVDQLETLKQMKTYICSQAANNNAHKDYMRKVEQLRLNSIQSLETAKNADFLEARNYARQFEEWTGFLFRLDKCSFAPGDKIKFDKLCLKNCFVKQFFEEAHGYCALY